MYSAYVALALACCLVVESFGAYTTVQVPAGLNSTLESYLCNGSLLTNGTSLQLGAGEHVISGGPFCSVRNLKDIAISGAGKDLTVVRCNNGGRGFMFSFVRNLTLTNMTFVGCGMLTTVPFPFINVGNITSPVVLYLDSSISVLIQHVTITQFSGFGIYGRALYQNVLEDVQFRDCTGNCSGALFYATSSAQTLTVQGCHFLNMSNHNTPLIGSGLSLWNSVGFYSVSIRGSLFSSLSSERGAVVLYKTYSTIANSTFIDHEGGAISTYLSYVTIINSTFSRNFADNGAAIYTKNNYYLFLSGSKFDGNVATAWGGAINLFSSKQYYKSITVTMWITNCMFTNNTAATVGGALFIFDSFPLSYVVIDQTILLNNSAPTGAAIYAGDFPQSDGSQTYSIILSDVLVIENHCYSCAVEDVMGAAVYYSEVSYVSIESISGLGSQFISNSPRGAIQGLSGGLHIYGNVLFKNNTGENGGAIGLLNNAHLYFYPNCNAVFEGNAASTFGGAIYIQGDPNIPKSALISCVIHFVGPQDNYSISFISNIANLSGQSIYATPIYNCSPSLPLELNNSDYYFNHPSAYYDRVFSVSANTSEVQILSFPLHIYLCYCNASNQCEVLPSGAYSIVTTPGRTIQFAATSIDSENHLSPTVVYTNVPPNSHNITLAPQQNVQWISKMCETIEYQIYGQVNTSINLQLSTFVGDVPTILQITLKPCGPGFVLISNSEGFLMCNCSSFLMPSIENCDLASGTVTRSDNKWIGLYNNGTNNLPAVVYTCPLDYCKLTLTQLSLAAPDELCDKNRQGLLCGHCSPNLSVVFGSTECQVCSDLWLLSILLYGVLGIVLVAVLFMINLTVTQGTIYGLIFYANVVQVNSSIFFDQPSLKPLQILISFINLDLGFPLCFYNGMDDAAKTGLQFVFPAYLLVLTITVVMVCHYCLRESFGSKISNVCLNRFSHFVGKRAVRVLATLIYLSYSKLLRTVIDILTYATVKVEGSSQFRVWFYDGTIRYLEGTHLALFIVAVVTSVFFIIPYTVALTLIPIISRYSDHNRLFTWLHQKANLLKPMNDAYYASFKGVWRSWLGVRLWLLLILYVPTPFYSSDQPYLLMYIHAIILVVFLFIQAHVKPFGEPSNVSSKVKWIITDIYNWTDSFYILNYTVLALTVSYLLSNGSNAQHITITVGSLVGLAGIMIFATVSYHTFMAIRNIHATRVTTKGRAASIPSSSMQSEIDIENTYETRDYEKPPPLNYVMSYAVLTESDLREPLMESL